MSHCCTPPATHYRAPLILLDSNRSPEDQEREQKEGLWIPASKFVNNCDRFNCARKGERRQEGNGYRESCSQAADASRDSRESSLRDFYSVIAFLLSISSCNAVQKSHFVIHQLSQNHQLKLQLAHMHVKLMQKAVLCKPQVGWLVWDKTGLFWCFHHLNCSVISN